MGEWSAWNYLSGPMEALRDLKWWFDKLTTLRQLEGQISNFKSEI
jgi:hypothetical protein